MGYGHRISAAAKPSGRSHLTRVGRPESPGFRQYVCQPFSISRRMPTVSGWPGRTASVSATSEAFTWRVGTT